MLINRLDRRVLIQRDDSPELDSGGISPWSVPFDVAEVWANLKRESQAEEDTIPGGVPVGRARYKVTIRYRGDISVNDRMRIKVSDTSRYLAIRHVPDVSRRERFIAMDCEEVE